MAQILLYVVQSLRVVEDDTTEGKRMGTRSRSGSKAERHTLRNIIEETRIGSARRAWERARLASRYRKIALQQGARSAAKILSAIKCRAIERAHELAPELVSIGIDDDLQIGLLSVAYRGLGRLHLPATASAGQCVWRHEGQRQTGHGSARVHRTLYLRTA